MDRAKLTWQKSEQDIARWLHTCGRYKINNNLWRSVLVEVQVEAQWNADCGQHQQFDAFSFKNKTKRLCLLSTHTPYIDAAEAQGCCCLDRLPNE